MANGGSIESLTSLGSSGTYVAQLTDMHVIDPERHDELFVPVNERLHEAVTGIEAETPNMDAVLATGDLTNWGRAEQYDHLVGLLSDLTTPVLAIPGNHDDRDRLRHYFPDLPWADAEHASWDVTVNNHVRIIGLDSTIPDEDGAEFDNDREEWLCDMLAKSPQDGVTQTVLALHHPPFSSGIQWMDKSGFVGLDRLKSVLKDSGIDRILCGHLHRPVQSVVSGIPAMVGISTIQHVALDFSDDASVSLINDPAGYQIHRFQGDESVTHTRYIDTDWSAYTPAWAAEKS